MADIFETTLKWVGGGVGGGLGGMVGAAEGGAAGTAIGAAVGTVALPFAGTVAGGAAGGVAGAAVGGVTGAAVGGASGYQVGGSAGAWIDETGPGRFVNEQADAAGDYIGQKKQDAKDWWYGDDEAAKEDDATANCAGNCVLSEDNSEKDRNKREDEKISELDKRSVQKPGNKSFNRDIPGTWDDANSDFDDFTPESVEDMDSGGRYGKLTDGRRINVRPNSSEGAPTLEIQRPDGKRPVRKYRYQ